MALFPETDFEAWTRRDVGSFAKRYYGPLWRVARLDFRSIDEDTARELAQGFVVRELEREPTFARYAPEDGHSARFRTYLRTCFFRYCRDQLEKESRRRGRSLEALPAEPPAASSSELERLIARDLLNVLRARVLEGSALGPQARRYLELKWPARIDDESRSDAAIARELGLSRGRLRGLKRKVLDRILLAVRAQLRADGLSSAAADRDLAGYVAILGREDAAGGDAEPS